MLPAFVSDPNPTLYMEDNYIVVDLETDNHDHGSALDGRNSIVLACWLLGPGHPEFRGTDVIDHHFGTEFDLGRLERAIRSADFVVAHGAKFELQWFARMGIELNSILTYDTLLGEYVLAGNRKVGLSLDDTAQRYGIGTKYPIGRVIRRGGETREIPPTLLLDYCRSDVEQTSRIFLSQRTRLRDANLLPVAYARNLVTPALADMEQYGMHLDAERVQSTYAERMAAYTELVDKMNALTGGINFKSGKQMREYLYDKLKFQEATDHRGNPLRTGAGKAKTDKAALAALKAGTPEQKAFLEVAQVVAKQKVPVQNLEKMMKVLRSNKTEVHAQFNQSVTQTHRLSSSGRGSGFQFHNFDRAFKPLFKARREDFVIVEGDAPQLEFRAATALTSDPVALQDIMDGADVHAFTASVLGVSRQEAKAHTFKPLYGGQSGTPKEKKYYAAFRAKYPTMFKVQTGWTHEVLRTGELTLPTGMRFYWPGTKMRDSGYIDNTPSIFNYPVQSFATADIIPLVLVMVWHRVLTEMPGDAFICNTIHDSIVAEVKESRLDEYVNILVDCFTRDIYTVIERLYGYKINVPLGVGVKAASHWGEGAERKYEPSVPVLHHRG